MPRFTIPLDPKSIGSMQLYRKAGTAGVATVTTDPVPSGINRLILHAEMQHDDVAGNRRIGMFVTSPNGLNTGVPCTLDGVVIAASGERSNALTEIWLPSGWYLTVVVGEGTITAAKLPTINYCYIDVLHI